MKDMKLKEVVSSTCDDSDEDIKVISKYWLEARRFRYSKHSKQLTAGVAEKTEVKKLAYC
jgi:hypothetical protein